MEITARVKFDKESDNRKFLLQEFYGKDFSPSNSIRIINDEVAFITLKFESTPPSNIIRALSFCFIELWEITDNRNSEVTKTPDISKHNENDIRDLTQTQGNIPEMTKKDEQPLPQAKSNVSIDEEAQKQIEESTDAAIKRLREREIKKASVKETHTDKSGSKEIAILNIPAFDEIAKDVSNFPEFVSKVCIWMKLTESYADCLSKLILAFSDAKEETPKISSALSREQLKSLEYNDNRYNTLSNKIRNVLNEAHVEGTTIPFIATVLHYKNKFGTNSETNTRVNEVAFPKEPSSTSNDDTTHEAASITSNEEPFLEVTNEQKDNSSKVSNNIFDFEAVVASFRKNPAVQQILAEKINPFLSSEEKALQFLTGMGLSKRSDGLYEYATKLISAAFSMNNIVNIDEVLITAGFNPGVKNDMLAKIRLSEWINNFNQLNQIKKMQLITFLRVVKAIFT